MNSCRDCVETLWVSHVVIWVSQAILSFLFVKYSKIHSTNRNIIKLINIFSFFPYFLQLSQNELIVSKPRVAQSILQNSNHFLLSRKREDSFAHPAATFNQCQLQTTISFDSTLSVGIEIFLFFLKIIEKKKKEDKNEEEAAGIGPWITCQDTWACVAQDTTSLGSMKATDQVRHRRFTIVSANHPSAVRDVMQWMIFDSSELYVIVDN